ncbi:MAG TPA: IPT/TIG domain-containing protein [Gaiellaceae bacterium]|nr:IPT/TIG domain-containing protein [Gaiellaceae bacterium]
MLPFAGSIVRFVSYGGAPTVTGIAPAIGDINGGDAVTITGTNFTGATGATVGGVSLTSFVVVNSTTITGVTGSHAAGVVNTVVTSGAGSGTGTSDFEYYDPTSLVDGYWSGEDYAVSLGTGTVTARKGVNLLEATNPPLEGTGGRALGGRKTIDSHTVTSPKLHAAATNLSVYSPLASGWGFAVVNFDAVSGANGDAAAYTNGQIFSDDGAGYQGLALDSIGGNHLQMWGYDAAARTDPQTATTGTWYMAIWKRDGSHIFSRLGSGSWSAGTALGTLGGTGNMKMFVNWNGASFVDGRVAVLGLGGSIPSDPNITKLISYVNARWGTSF